MRRVGFGVLHVALPRQNEKDVNEDLGPELKREITIHFVSTIDDVLELALLPKPVKQTHDDVSADGAQVHETVQ